MNANFRAVLCLVAAYGLGTVAGSRHPIQSGATAEPAAAFTPADHKRPGCGVGCDCGCNDGGNCTCGD